MWAALLLSLAAQCSGAACPNPCTQCAFQPDEGTNPSLASWRTLFTDVSRRQNLDGLPAIPTIEAGPTRAREAAEFPCKLLPAIAMAESSISQFCDNGLTVISFDCGFGVMQVTSGASRYPGLQSRADINVAAGADILAQKWNGDQSFGGHFGDSDPRFLESWYFATWAYNGFVYSNNPSNPDRPANRPPFNSPSTLSRRSYPYQEIVWGYLGFPQSKEGEQVFSPLLPTYPPTCSGGTADRACCDADGNCVGVPNQSGLFDVTIPLPQPAHADPCVEVCPPSGCPPADRRTLIFDDADAGFSLDGDVAAVASHAEGGFQDGFRSVAPVAAGATVTARWQGPAPASGTFAVAGFVPLSPAENSAVQVTVIARGGPRTFTLDQDVAGGFFAPLGVVTLLAGETVVVEVENVSADTVGHIGLDAFRFDWRGDGDVTVGSGCSESTDCVGDGICLQGRCAVGCEAVGCGAGDVCDTATGLCAAEGEGEGEGTEGEGEAGEGEGEGEGEPGPRTFPRSVVGCTCASAGVVDLGLIAVVALLVRRRRRCP